jgi:hypothetical protein
MLSLVRSVQTLPLGLSDAPDSIDIAASTVCVYKTFLSIFTVCLPILLSGIVYCCMVVYRCSMIYYVGGILTGTAFQNGKLASIFREWKACFYLSSQGLQVEVTSVSLVTSVMMYYKEQARMSRRPTTCGKDDRSRTIVNDTQVTSTLFSLNMDSYIAICL